MFSQNIFLEHNSHWYIDTKADKLKYTQIEWDSQSNHQRHWIHEWWYESQNLEAQLRHTTIEHILHNEAKVWVEQHESMSDEVMREIIWNDTSTILLLNNEFEVIQI